MERRIGAAACLSSESRISADGKLRSAAVDIRSQRSRNDIVQGLGCIGREVDARIAETRFIHKSAAEGASIAISYAAIMDGPENGSVGRRRKGRIAQQRLPVPRSARKHRVFCR